MHINSRRHLEVWYRLSAQLDPQKQIKSQLEYRLPTQACTLASACVNTLAKRVRKFWIFALTALFEPRTAAGAATGFTGFGVDTTLVALCW